MPETPEPPLRVWYVAGQRLCNFDCPYCVSVGDWSKSRRTNWKTPQDLEDFRTIVRWIGTRPHEVSVRLGSLGEPFASPDFLEEAGWLTLRPNVRFVELLSNASLLARRLPRMVDSANLGKLSLWLTYHDGEIDLDRFFHNARVAQEDFGCFTVVNVLLFPDNGALVERFVERAREYGMRYNVDLGYDPELPSEQPESPDPEQAVPILGTTDILRRVECLGGDTDLTKVALQALRGPRGLPCSAGHDHVFIGIDGQVYPCSRYHVLEHQRIGNVLDPDFRLERREKRWAPCAAEHSCCNKEDFLNLEPARGLRPENVPSLGWTDA